MLWLTAVRLGYRDRTGMVLGLLFGLATIAWPYAKQFFGEPLSAVSLLGCFYGLLAWRQTGRWRWLVVAGIGAGVAIATVNAHAVSDCRPCGLVAGRLAVRQAAVRRQASSCWACWRLPYQCW